MNRTVSKARQAQKPHSYREIKGDEILTKGPSEMGRRHFIKLLTIAAAGAGISCNDDPPHTDNPPPPDPVYELVYGLYDNFDGQGGHQDYDNTELAVAGALSSQLWRGNFDVVNNPSGLVAVVNENGHYVQYGWEDREVQKIISYLKTHGQAVSSWDRENLEKVLNDRGKELVSDIEWKDTEKQHKILQYVLSNRKGFFNPKGLKLDEIMHEKNTQELVTQAQDTYTKLIDVGFTHDELSALSYLQNEVRLYNGSLAKTLRDAGKKGINRVKTALGIETRIEPVEYKYTFDRKGNLIDAQPHIPGQPYQGAKKLMWVDEQGKIHATAQTVPGYYALSASGYVVQMESETQGDARLELINPEDIEFKDYKSFSADLMIPSAAECTDFNIDLDYHTSGIHGPVSSLFQIGIIKSGGDNVYIFANGGNKNTDYRFWYNIKDVPLDSWENVRMDIYKDNENKLVVEFFHNGQSKAKEYPPDGDMYWDPNQTDFGPKRSFALYSQLSDPGKLIAFIDNVNAVYKNRTA